VEDVGTLGPYVLLLVLLLALFLPLALLPAAEKPE
jgi:hypothetical protein